MKKNKTASMGGASSVFAAGDWPSPSTPMNLSSVASHSGLHRSTFVRAIRAIEAGEDPQCRIPQVKRIAKLFADAGGPGALVYASRVIEIFGETPERVAPECEVPDAASPPKKQPVRERFGKREAALIRRIPDEEIRRRLQEAIAGLAASNNKANRGRLEALVAAMDKRELPLPQVRLAGGLDLRDIRAFASFGEFMGRAGPGDGAAWVFVLTASGRPVDIDSARQEDLAGGTIAVLTRDEYLAELAASDRNGKDAKRAESERSEIEAVFEKGRAARSRRTP